MGRRVCTTWCPYVHKGQYFKEFQLELFVCRLRYLACVCYCIVYLFSCLKLTIIVVQQNIQNVSTSLVFVIAVLHTTMHASIVSVWCMLLVVLENK